ncbi:MAG: cytochrome c biogenesis heme-transporting ATPase CcmA [Kangiellaceae bacterium]|nr:cytochrome c biogenesis heme-transporting ATPase CcmA [Kangiellaceae bacterium]
MYQQTDNILKIKNLAVFRSELPLFESIDFELRAGNAIQISGTNGAGKTSLLRCLCGLSSRHEGEILWNGRSIDKNKEDYLDQLLYLGHSLGLKPKLTVQQNLRFYQGLRFVQDDDSILEALTALKIAQYLDEMVGNLSAGQKRRVALARVVCEPVKLWILDEPMVALDTEGQKWLERVCNSHLDTGGMILLTSHQKLEGINNLTELTLQIACLASHYEQLKDNE